MDATKSALSQQPPALRRTLWSMRLNGFTHAAAGAVFTLLITAATLNRYFQEVFSISDYSLFEFLVVLALSFTIIYWPIQLIINLVYTTTPQEIGILTVAYFATLLAFILISATIYHSLALIGPYLRIWLNVNLPLTLLGFRFARRRLSAAMPLLFPFVLMGFGGWILMLDGVRLIFDFFPLGPFEKPVLWVARLSGLFIFVGVAYAIVRLTGLRYSRHRFGDQQFLTLIVLLLVLT